VIYKGRAGYSDMTFLKNGSLGVFFEKDSYNTVSFVAVDVPIAN